MTQSENQDIDADIFDMQPAKTKNAPTLDEKASVNEQPAHKKTRSNFLLHLKPVHFVACTLGIVFLWVIVPYIFPASKNIHGSTPEALINIPVPEHVPTLSENEKVMSASQSDFPNENISTSEPPFNAVAQVEEKQISALQEQIDTLQKKIEQIEVKLVQHATLISAKKKTITNHKLKEKISAPSKVTSSKFSKETVHTDFNLNTIYRDQAWIQNKKEDSIHLVQTGDVIGDFRVLHIEPDKRRVVTTLGDIR